MKTIDIVALETVVGGGALASAAGIAVGVTSGIATFPAMPYLFVGGGVAGATYVAYKAGQVGYARDGVRGAIKNGARGAVAGGLYGAGIAAIGPAVLAGGAVYEGVKRLGG